MADDFVAAFAGRVGGVLALPMKVRVIDPVIHVLVLVSPALFFERDQQDVRLFVRQHPIADFPIAGVIGLAKQRRNVFAHERLTERQIQWIDDVAQASERAHVIGGRQVFVVRVVGFQNVLAITALGDHPQQVLDVAAVVLPLDGLHIACDRATLTERDQLKQQIIFQSDLVPVRADKCSRTLSNCLPVVP